MKKRNHVQSDAKENGSGNKSEAFLPDATKFYLNISSSPSLHTNEKKWLKRLRSATCGDIFLS